MDTGAPFPEPADDETFAGLLGDLMRDYRIASGSALARRIDVSVSTVNTWLHNKRVPRPDAIERLADAFPRYSRERLAAAAGRRMPGPLAPEAEERLLDLFRGLTAEQQAMMEIQMQALKDANR